jgi:transcriptional regulator with XRE-family HTH domain
MVLGKRVHELRAARKWSQEEFAHVGGLHRTYIGQIERGEKNISFGNLVKISSVLGVTMSDLLAGLEAGGGSAEGSKRRPEVGSRNNDPARRMFEIQKLAKRLGVQRTAMDRTILLLEELATRDVRTNKPAKVRAPKR